jgi:hypothetical protein
MSGPQLPEHPQHLDLVALLRGELGTSETLAAEDHLRGCEACRDDLLVTVTGHALMRRTSGTLGDVDLPPVRPLPAPPHPTRLPARRPRLALVAAAAAVLVAGAGVGAGVTRLVGGTGSDDGPGGAPDPTPAAVVAALDPVEGSATGEVEMTSAGDRSTRMTIRTAGLPPAPSGDFYYVWLLDPETNKMLPLGLVEPGGSASFRIDESLLTAYTSVDVSLESDDGDPGHSVTSVLRGSYAT